MILDKYFDRIVILSLPDATARAARAMRELRGKGLSGKAVVVRAVDGRLVKPSDWWPSGDGAWGCLMSHQKVVQDALMDGVESLLVIEDDCIWQSDAAAMAERFLAEVPADWGQIYLGGQHRSDVAPKILSSCLMKPHSVHRTHAYAVHRRAMPRMLKHILYAPDYISAQRNHGFYAHVDHQLEVAHGRGDWPVYCPTWWLAGQGANLSSIDGKDHPDEWWHMVRGDHHRRMPVVVCDRRPAARQMKWLHFGCNLALNDPSKDMILHATRDSAEFLRLLTLIASEAAGSQRLPAFRSRPEAVRWAAAGWLGPVLSLADKPDLAALCDFPRSKALHHDWFNPRPRPAVAAP